MSTSTADFLAVAEDLWPTGGAEEWDRPGLAVGSVASNLNKVLLAVDVTLEVIQEAKSLGAQMVFSHHPLLLRGVSSVSESTAKGAIVAEAVRSGIAVFSSHTNADIVEDGVSDTIAKSLGLSHIRPLVPTGPNIGHGRVGVFDSEVSVGELVEKLGRLLPVTSRGISSTASSTLLVRRVALCGGAGDSFIEAAALEADIYITSDLRHHVAVEAQIPLIDVSHWASESLWLQVAKGQLSERLPELEFVVSSTKTDPWIFIKNGEN